MGNIRWRYKISPKQKAIIIAKENPGAHIDVSHGSMMGYHIMNWEKVLCRISKSTFNAMQDGATEEQPPFINTSTYKIKNFNNEQEVKECDATGDAQSGEAGNTKNITP